MEGKKDKTARSRRPGQGPEDFLTEPSQIKPPAALPEKGKSLGERVRSAREAHGLELAELSERISIDTAKLRSIEAGETAPTLGELVKLGKALETRMGYFISPGADKPVTIVRRDERRSVPRQAGRKAQPSYSYESLAPDKANRSMEPFVVTLLATGVEETSTHDGQEFVFVLEGKVMARVGQQTEVLNPGDSIYYDSNQPHYLKSLEGKEAKILAVLFAG